MFANTRQQFVNMFYPLSAEYDTNMVYDCSIWHYFVQIG